MEFSSLGGWVATRASGMKKNIYGNIEDLVNSSNTFSSYIILFGGLTFMTHSERGKGQVNCSFLK